MSNPRTSRMNAGTTQVFLSNVFASYGLHHLRSGKEHIRSTFHHKSKVGKSRRINRTTRTRTEDTRNLRNNTRSEDVTLENLSITRQRIDTFLNTCATRVIDTDTRSTHLHGHIHHLTNLERHGFRKRTCRYGKILCKHIHQSSFNSSVTCYHTVARIMLLIHAEVGTTMLNEHIQFFKATLVKQHCNAFASRIFAFGVLFFYRFFSAAHSCFGAKFY